MYIFNTSASINTSVSIAPILLNPMGYISKRETITKLPNFDIYGTKLV